MAGQFTAHCLTWHYSLSYSLSCSSSYSSSCSSQRNVHSRRRESLPTGLNMTLTGITCLPEITLEIDNKKIKCPIVDTPCSRDIILSMCHFYNFFKRVQYPFRTFALGEYLSKRSIMRHLRNRYFINIVFQQNCQPSRIVNKVF